MIDDYFEKIATFGKAINQKGESCDVSINLKYNKYIPDQIECQISSAQEKWPIFLKLFQGTKTRLEIIGDLENEQKLHIENVYGYSLKGCTADLNINSFSIGYIDKIPLDSGYIFIEASIPEAPSIEVPKSICLSYLGEIENKRKDKDAISWENSFGEFSIADFYKYERGKIGVEDAVHRIKIYQIRINKKFNNSFFVKDIIPNIEEELEDILWLLSFINRRRIFWYEININFFSVEQKMLIPEFTQRRKISRSKEKKWKEYLISQQDLADGGFYKLLKTYKSFSLKGELRRAIIYTVASYERDVIEAQIQSIYLAIEVLVNSLSEKYNFLNIIPKAPFNLLLKDLKGTISHFFSNMKIENKNKKSQIIKNILGLNTIPFVDRFYQLIKELKIETLDFFKEPDELKPRLEEIQIRRNRLIHKGEVKEIDKLYEDLVILKALSERIILKLLNWPIDKTFISAFKELHAIRS